MKGQSNAVNSFRTAEMRLIRHIDRIRKGAKKPDEKKPPGLHVSNKRKQPTL